MKREKLIYTIGHSNHPEDYFIALLKKHSVNCVVDVRSVAASRFNPQYNKKALQNYLQGNNMSYLHFGEEFGARQTNPQLLNDEGQVDFEKIRKSAKFQEGLLRLTRGIEKGFTIALMCSESIPLDCHRFSMISFALKHSGFKIRHILKDMSVISNEELEEQLLKKYEKELKKLTVNFDLPDKNFKLDYCYQLQNKKIGFMP